MGIRTKYQLTGSWQPVGVGVCGIDIEEVKGAGKLSLNTAQADATANKGIVVPGDQAFSTSATDTLYAKGEGVTIIVEAG